VSTGQTMEN